MNFKCALFNVQFLPNKMVMQRVKVHHLDLVVH